MNEMATTGERRSEIVRECQDLMAHAWMVRTFVKHCEEVEDFPELMGVVRAVFDTSRALETRLSDPLGYTKMLAKKMGRLRRATEQFAEDAPLASTHTNFQQAVRSMQICLGRLDELLAECRALPE